MSDNGRKAPIVSELASATFGLWFPFFRWMTGHLPAVWVARLARASAERAIWEREHVREAIVDNYRRVLGPLDRRALEDAAQQMITRHSRLWIDLLRYSTRPDLPPATILARRIGDGRLLDAHKEGRGGILLTAHVGNFELGGVFLRELGLTVHAVYAPDPSPVIEAHRTSARQLLGVTGIPVTNSPFAFVPILSALKENAFVAIQGDRDISGTGWRFPFFGEAASFPVGPFKLAALSGAPLFPVFVLQEDDGRYRTVVEEAIPVDNPPGAEAKEAALRKAMGLFVAVMERTIRENPTQWYVFRRFWE